MLADDKVGGDVYMHVVEIMQELANGTMMVMCLLMVVLMSRVPGSSALSVLSVVSTEECLCFHLAARIFG